MSSNDQELIDIYTKITSYEMVKSLQNCGTIWKQIGLSQYQTSLNVKNDFWDIFLSKDITTGRTILDFRKNTVYFYSITSDDNTSVNEMFNEISEDVLNKDAQILSDINQLPWGCRKKYDIVMNGGVFASGNSV